jgi:hypothetical protein
MSPWSTSFGYHPLNDSDVQKKTGSKHTIPNSNVGKEAISQTISALEHWRCHHAHCYRDIPEAQTPLRSDCRVKTIEAAKKHDEPKRIESSQALKATGSSSGQPFFPRRVWATLMTFLSDTYTEAELMRCATWCLKNFSGVQRVYVGLRDAAMLLFSATTAVRGGSSRILRWSDMFVSYIPMDDVCIGRKVPVSHENEMEPTAAHTKRIFPSGPCGPCGQRKAQPARPR